jgi:hypothetical protein
VNGLLLFATISVVVAVGAMLPPRVASVMPPGAQRGTEVEWTVSGERLVDVKDLLLCDPGLELLTVVAGKNAESCMLKVRVHQDAKLGAHAMRLRTAGGLSNLFHVFIGAQPEVAEARTDNGAQVLQLPCTVGAEMTGEDPDRYVVALAAGARCVCEIEAMRLLRSPIDLMLSVRGPDGNELGRVDDTAFGHKDPVLAFVAGVAGAYEIVVEQAFADRVNTGAYRLHVGDLPRPTATVPAGVQPMQKTPLALLGDGALVTTEVELSDDGTGYAPVFTQDARGVSPTPVWVRVGGPIEVATEPSSDPEKLPLLPYPSSTTGVVTDRAGVRYRIAAKKGEAFEFRVLTQGIRSPLDPVMGVRNKDGLLLAGDDDAGAPASDAFVRLTAREDGELFLTVRDVMRRHSPMHVFRLECGVRAQTTKCRLVVARGQDPVVTIPIGSHGGMVLQVDDADVEAGLTFVLDGLPPGVTAVFGRVQKGQNLVPFVLHAVGDVPLAASLASLSLRAEKEPLVRSAGYAQVLPLVTARNDQAILSVLQQKLPVAIAAQVPFGLELVPPTVPIVRGAPLAVQVRIRRVAGFLGEVRLRALWTPTGVGAGEVTVPAAQDVAMLPLDAGANAPLGPFALAVRATAVGKDEAFEVCSGFCEVVVDKPWLTAKVEGGRATLGAELSLPLVIEKDAEQKRAIVGPLQVRLLSLPRGVTAEAVAVAAEAVAGAFTVHIAADAAVGKHKNVVLEVRVPVEGGEVVHRYGIPELRIDEPKRPKKAKPTAVDASVTKPTAAPSGESKGGPR